MVASEPVTDRLGPRSMPIAIAERTSAGIGPELAAVPATRPAGRLFIRLDANATIAPAPHAVARGAAWAAARRVSVRAAIRPVWPTPATSTNRPATRASTLHDTCCSRAHGASRRVACTAPIAIAEAISVGAPSGKPRADAASIASTTPAMPTAASRPVPDNAGTCGSDSTGAASSPRKTSASSAHVTTTDAMDGSANARNQANSGGMCSPNTTRLAGFEIGSTKLAAFAMNAQANR